MQIKILSRDECQAALQRATFGRLACVRYNRPYIVPISFACSDGALYGYAMTGRKIHWMRTNPHVCIEVEDVRDRFNWTTLVVEGCYEELPDDSGHRSARAQALRLLQARRRWMLPAAIAPDPSRLRNPVVYRIRIGSVSGRHAFRRSGLEQPVGTPTSTLRRWWERVVGPFRRQPAAA
jgi:uncharacterized protein